MYRKTIMILALALSLVIALLALASDADARDRLGPAYWILGLSIIGCVALVLTGYVWDRALMNRLREVADKQKAFAGAEADNDPDEVLGLARNIEKLAQALQKIEASYRGIVEDQIDLICRFKGDGRLTFVNGAYARFFGKKRQDLVGQPFPLFHLGLAGGANRGAGETSSYESALESSTGGKYWMLWTQRVIRSPGGEVIEYQAVGHDFTPRKEAEAALLAAKDAAETADRAKSEFLAMVSHEIRTPINAVLGFATLLGEGQLTTEQREQIAMIRSGAQTLESLISDILDLSKMEAGRIDLEQQPFALQTCVNDVCSFFHPKARGVALKLEARFAPDVPGIVVGDQARLRQILINLIGNALKFTERGSVTVQVTSAASDHPPAGQAPTVRLFFAVSDTGIGIPADKLDYLFKPFSQVDSSATRRRGGTGLGLIICKRLCERMGGAISVESRVGEGSTFRFSIVAGVDREDGRKGNR